MFNTNEKVVIKQKKNLIKCGEIKLKNKKSDNSLFYVI